ncbi:hypothetical protein GGQ68_004670 [Sagittula marina]|uniref:Uncharacterized protein n=2 Tax=Sagittula marina TaxID=943940 RepID=A0A7W6DSG5_9RHOB|nr:hypothetical protein [Sagittula marina]
MLLLEWVAQAFCKDLFVFFSLPLAELLFVPNAAAVQWKMAIIPVLTDLSAGADLQLRTEGNSPALI